VANIEDLLQRRTDLSTFLVHLTRAPQGGGSAFDNLKSIIEWQTVRASTPFGPAKHLEAHLAGSAATQTAVCMTETPLEHVWMMLEDISGRTVQFEPYGLAITKTRGRISGFNPVWYTDMTPSGRDWLSKSVDALISQAVTESSSSGALDPAELQSKPVFKIAPFFEQMGPTNMSRKEFWWEREWRKTGDFHFSFPSRVVALLAPERQHGELIEFFAQLDAKQSTRWQRRPVLDPRWGLERMIVELAQVPPEDVGPFPD
jgi:hypothetical protein